MLTTICLVGSLLASQTTVAQTQGAPSTGAQAIGAQEATNAEQDADLEQQVRRLARQLDDSELAQREAAVEQLIALGPKALDFLPAPNPKMAAEIRQRLDRVRSALETAAAEANLRATAVTLSGDMSLSDAIEAIQTQTGNKLAGFEGRDAIVKAEFAEVPFWPALDRLLDQTGLSVDPFGGQANTLVLIARPENETARSDRVSYDGAFRVEPLRIFSLRDLKHPPANSLRVAIEVSWEPRLAPVTIYQSLDRFEAWDETGKSLQDAGGSERLEFTVRPGMTGMELELPLPLPARDARRIARLSGKLSAVIPGRIEAFVFGGNLARARDVEISKGRATVTLDEVGKNLDLFQVRMRVRFDDPAGALESHRGWIYGNEAFLVNAKGERIENAGLEMTRQSDREIGVAYLFDLPDGIEGCQLTYMTPASIWRHEVSYEFKDLELP